MSFIKGKDRSCLGCKRITRDEERKCLHCRKEEFHRIDNNNETDSVIAARVGMSELTICRWRRKAGGKKIPPHKGVPARVKSEPETAEFMKNNYAKLSDNEIAAALNCDSSIIRIWADKLNLTRKGHKGKWSRTSHPRGMLNKTHSEEECKKISERALKMWKDPLTPLRTEEMSDRRSNNGVRISFEKRNQPRYSRSRAGKRADLGDKYFRSAWEANYARYLNFLISKNQILKWEYESETFWFEGIKRGCRFYTPDFKIFESETATPYFVEIKGWMDQKSRTKLDRMKRYHPSVRLDLVTLKEYKEIKEWAGLIPGWEYT